MTHDHHVSIRLLQFLFDGFDRIFWSESTVVHHGLRARARARGEKLCCLLRARFSAVPDFIHLQGIARSRKSAIF